MQSSYSSKRSLGQKNILSLAVASTLITSLPNPALADTSIIGQIPGVFTWSGVGENLTIASSGSVIGSGTAGATDALQAMGDVGTLTNLGTISTTRNTASAFVNFDGQASVNNGATGLIRSTNGDGIYNGGSIGTLSNAGIITAGRWGVINWASGGLIDTLSNQQGGTITAGETGVYNRFSLINTLSNAGDLHGDTYGVRNNGSGQIGQLNNLAGGTLSGLTAVFNEVGTIGTLSNAGLISGDEYGVTNGSAGTITQLSNLAGGTISTQYASVLNEGSLGTLSNAGLITGATALQNSGTLAQVSNLLGGTLNGGGVAIYNMQHITAFENAGLIHGQYGIYNLGAATLDSLSNDATGTISGDYAAVLNEGSLLQLSNAGLISAASAVENRSGASLGTLSNLAGGTLSGTTAGVYNDGSIAQLENAGLIRGNTYAIYITGAIDSIANSGVIAGSVVNDGVADLVISGGSGATFGTLTGTNGGIGTIANNNSDLIFSAGNLLLNDNISVVSGQVNNSGATVQVNNAITIAGDYTQAAAASLIFGVADGAVATGDSSTDSGYGRIKVNGGDVTLAAGTSIALKTTGSTYAFAQGQRYVVFMASGATNYNESALNYSALGASGLTVTGASVVDSNSPAYTDLVLTLNGASGSGSAINGATYGHARAALDGLFHYTGTDSQLLGLFNPVAATGDSTSGANRAGAQLSPSALNTAAASASTQGTQQVVDIAGMRMDNLRSVQTGGASGIASGDSAVSNGLWGQAFGGRAKQQERDDVAGYHANFGGLLLGADAELNDSWRAGGLFSYANTSVRNDGSNKGSSATIDSYGLIGYASYTANPWYLNLSGGVIQHQYDSSRAISLTGFDGKAKADYDGLQYLAAVQAGYPIALGNTTTLTPLAGLTYSTLDLDSYTEKGSAAALHVKASDSDSLKSDLGAKLERSFATPYGELVPQAQLTWRHEFKDDGLRSVANFSADSSGETTFASSGPSAINDTGVLSLGATLVRSSSLSLSAKYSLEAGSGYTANTGNLQARWAF